MAFIHPLLLGGLALVGIPVLLHLLMQQKPKRLVFPAFRFLLERHRSNQRRLRFRHLLLLLLRMALIALFCLALARPKMAGSQVGAALTGERPVQAVFLLDTSLSMEYTSAGKSCLDEAKRRALELLEEMPEGSKIAVLDSAEAGGEWSPSLALARERLAGLELHHLNSPLTRQIEQAYRLFQELDQEEENPAEALPRVLYIFSDRTRACWDEAEARKRQQQEEVVSLFVDVGQDGPADLAITAVQAEPTTIRAGERVRINVTVQATGTPFDTEVICTVDGKPPEERLPIKLLAGSSQVLTFERQAAGPGSGAAPTPGLSEGLHQVSLRLASNDALPFNNAGCATFRVLEARRILILGDNPEKDAREWARALAQAFRPELRAVTDADTLDFSSYQAVFLVNLARPKPELWERLKAYVMAGGGLGVVPGGEGWRPDLKTYAQETAGALLPGRFLNRVTPAKGEEQFWHELERDPQKLAKHPFLRPFARWRGLDDVDFLTMEAAKPRARHFWKVDGPEEGVLVHYTDTGRSPALLERILGRGRVLMLTTSFDRHKDGGGQEWNNYFELSSFGFVLANLVAGYLAGDTEEPSFNYQAGQAVTVPLPLRPFFPHYTLIGPGITGTTADLPRNQEQKELRITQALIPGNFQVLDGDGQRLSAFSMYPDPGESQLDRVPPEPIEALLGPESVLPVGRRISLRERLQERWRLPLELAPSFLLLLLVVLAVENFLANKFYKKPQEEDSKTGVPEKPPGLAGERGVSTPMGSTHSARGGK